MRRRYSLKITYFSCLLCLFNLACDDELTGEPSSTQSADIERNSGGDQSDEAEKESSATNDEEQTGRKENDSTKNSTSEGEEGASSTNDDKDDSLSDDSSKETNLRSCYLPTSDTCIDYVGSSYTTALDCATGQMLDECPSEATGGICRNVGPAESLHIDRFYYALASDRHTICTASGGTWEANLTNSACLLANGDCISYDGIGWNDESANAHCETQLNGTVQATCPALTTGGICKEQSEGNYKEFSTSVYHEEPIFVDDVEWCTNDNGDWQVYPIGSEPPPRGVVGEKYYSGEDAGVDAIGLYLSVDRKGSYASMTVDNGQVCVQGKLEAGLNSWVTLDFELAKSSSPWVGTDETLSWTVDSGNLERIGILTKTDILGLDRYEVSDTTSSTAAVNGLAKPNWATGSYPDLDTRKILGIWIEFLGSTEDKTFSVCVSDVKVSGYVVPD